MPRALDPELRAAILASIQAIADGQAPERSAAAVAREHDVSRPSVTKIAAAHDLSHVWNREHTARASRAKQQDNRALRAELSRQMLEDASRLRQRLWVPSTTVTATGAKVVTEIPTAADAKHLLAYQSLVKSSADIDARDAADDQHAAVDAWLASLLSPGA
ncbi:hypothetical protein [Actinomycetospora aeridis]|uniref:Uncharacterized protein n=1 Tax=Actinomycetospora aeridis TaxID=3129231 RepID=A0ABU8N2H4_9PSEU